MRKVFFTLFMAAIFSVGSIGTARAELFNRGCGLIYDSVQNITWYDFTYVASNWADAYAWADQLDSAELDTLLGKYEAEMEMQVSILQEQAQRRNLSPSGTPRDAYINAALARTHREAMLWSAIQENWIWFYQNELNWVRRLRQRIGGM